MRKPFDPTMRPLYEQAPAAWLEFLGIPVPDPSQVQVIDSNLSTITAEADKVVRVGGAEPLSAGRERAGGANPRRAPGHVESDGAGVQPGAGGDVMGGDLRPDGVALRGRAGRRDHRGSIRHVVRDRRA